MGLYPGGLCFRGFCPSPNPSLGWDLLSSSLFDSTLLLLLVTHMFNWSIPAGQQFHLTKSITYRQMTEDNPTDPIQDNPFKITTIAKEKIIQVRKCSIHLIGSRIQLIAWKAPYRENTWSCKNSKGHLEKEDLRKGHCPIFYLIPSLLWHFGTQRYWILQLGTFFHIFFFSNGFLKHIVYL